MKIIKSWIETSGFHAKINNGVKNIFVYYEEDTNKYMEYRYKEFVDFTKEFTSEYISDLSVIKDLDVARNNLEDNLDLIIWGLSDYQW